VSAQKDVNGRENVHCTTHTWNGHSAPGIVFGAIGARPDFRPIKPAPSAQSAAVITAATAMSVKKASEAKTRCFILAGPKGKERPRRSEICKPSLPSLIDRAA
jgi:hypothetical protein